MHNRGVVPCIPAQGSVGASGDLAPLAHLAAVLIGEGAARVGTARACRRATRWPLRARAARTGAQGGPRAAQRHAGVDGARARGIVRRRAGDVRRRSSQARCRSMRASAATRRSTRASMPCAATADRSTRRHFIADCSKAARSARRTRVPSRAGSVQPALPAAGDGCLRRPDALCGRYAADRSERRVRQSARVRRRRAKSCRAETSMRSPSRSRPTTWRWRSPRSARCPNAGSRC